MRKSQTAFYHAVEAFERAPGLWTAYYNGGVGHIDVMDAEKYKGSQIFARNISLAFARDLVLAGANVTVIMNDPSEAEAFKWVCDGADVVSVIKEDNLSWGKLYDLDKVREKAMIKMGTRDRIGTVSMFTFQRQFSDAKLNDYFSMGLHVIPKNYLPPHGSVMDYILRGK